MERVEIIAAAYKKNQISGKLKLSQVKLSQVKLMQLLTKEKEYRVWSKFLEANYHSFV